MKKLKARLLQFIEDVVWRRVANALCIGGAIVLMFMDNTLSERVALLALAILSLNFRET